MKTPASAASAWSAFTYPVFRDLWLATLVSNVGTWMQSVGAAWLMTSLSPSPVMVALVQSASIFPMFLLALPAGALADIIDRRRLLLFTQAWMTLIAAALAALTLLGATTPWLLLGLTFALGLGAALNGPAWQAIVPELVPRSELAKAISANSAGFNVSRALGPAAGGAIVAAAGTGATFALNAISFLGVIFVLYRWRRPGTETTLPAERMLAGIRSGFRYVRHAPALGAVLWRSGIFIFFASSLWALLPLVAKYELGGGPTVYGLLLGCFGAGAVAGAVLLPPLQRYLSGEPLIAGMTLLFAAMVAVPALVPRLDAVLAAMLLSGGAWLIIVSTFNVAIQIAVPSWVRARALALFMLIFGAGLSLGSAAWGALATHRGLQPTLLYSAAGVALGLLALLRYPVKIDEESDLTPSLHWPEPHLGLEPRPDQGPVLVTVEYRIDPHQAHAFSQAMHALSLIRRRDGAIRWGLFQDTANPGLFLETFIVETWVEHLRQHTRITKADRDIEEQAFSFHTGTERPQVHHYLYAYGRRRRDRRRFLRRLK
jgi:MFS family permease/quinol monooxygenase YgiN